MVFSINVKYTIKKRLEISIYNRFISKNYTFYPKERYSMKAKNKSFDFISSTTVLAYLLMPIATKRKLYFY